MHLQAIPPRLFTSALPTGGREFFCYLQISAEDGPAAPVERLTWEIRDGDGRAIVGGTHWPSEAELAAGRFPIAASLPPDWQGGTFQACLHAGADSVPFTAAIEHYVQPGPFRLPLTGPVLVVGGHRIGEVHRLAGRIFSQQFGWDFIGLGGPGWSVFAAPPSEALRAQDFAGFGREVVAPADGTVVRAADDRPDLVAIGQLPAPETFLADLTLALGNYVVIAHAGGVWSVLAHLQQGSVQVQVGQALEAGQIVGRLGNSGNSSGPHLHFHCMDGPDLLTASPLPIALDVEGETSVPQAGQLLEG